MPCDQMSWDKKKKKCAFRVLQYSQMQNRANFFLVFENGLQKSSHGIVFLCRQICPRKKTMAF